jgi:hypothetical protein
MAPPSLVRRHGRDRRTDGRRLALNCLLLLQPSYADLSAHASPGHMLVSHSMASDVSQATLPIIPQNSIAFTTAYPAAVLPSMSGAPSHSICQLLPSSSLSPQCTASDLEMTQDCLIVADKIERAGGRGPAWLVSSSR